MAKKRVIDSVIELKAELEESPAAIVGAARSAPADAEIKTDALDPFSPDWTNRVLGELGDAEVWTSDDGVTYPRVAGLRRFVRKHFTVLENRTDPPVLGAVGAGGVPYVGVTHHVRVAPRPGFPQLASGTAVAGPHNLDGFVYAGETAETRAEGRAYVRLLGLGVCTSDEIAKSLPRGVDVVRADTLSETQAVSIRSFCDRLKTDPRDVVFMVTGRRDFTSLRDVPAEHYKAIFKKLDDIQKEIIKQ